jgi:hypothetical protein
LAAAIKSKRMVVEDCGLHIQEDCLPTFIQFDATQKELESMSSSSSGNTSSVTQENVELKRKLHEMHEQLNAAKKWKEEHVNGTGKKQKGKKYSKNEMVTSTTESRIKEYVANTLFRAVKYIDTDDLRDKGLKYVYENANITTEADMKKYKGHVTDLIVTAINKCRDNKIKALKRAVWHTRGGIGK